MATDLMSADGEVIGVIPWARVLVAADRLAAEAGEEALPEPVPWGADTGDPAEAHPEAWVIVHLAEDPVDDRAEILAVSERASELLRRAGAHGTWLDARMP
jgi:hypothetical protein